MRVFVFCPYISTQLELTAKKLGREGRKEKGGRKYQFSAMSAFPRGRTLRNREFLCLEILGLDDLFFFFWSWRPIFSGDWRLANGGGVEGRRDKIEGPSGKIGLVWLRTLLVWLRDSSDVF